MAPTNARELRSAPLTSPLPATRFCHHPSCLWRCNKTGVAAAVYSVVEQPNGTTQGLVCAKSRLARRNLTIPRLELVAGHMAIKLATNVERAINQNRVKAIHFWLDSSVALYWINGQGDFRQFVANWVAKIQEHNHVKWHHFSTHENPADLGSRGGKALEIWPSLAERPIAVATTNDLESIPRSQRGVESRDEFSGTCYS